MLTLLLSAVILLLFYISLTTISNEQFYFLKKIFCLPV